jgi:flavin-dependent dehydrogenase
VRVHFRDRFVEVMKKSNLALLISRKVFDNLLLEKAKETGIEVHTGEKVLCCREISEYVEVETNRGHTGQNLQSLPRGHRSS